MCHSGMYILTLRRMLRIPNQVINSAIKIFFNKLNSYYALITIFYRWMLLFIKFNWISIDRNNSIIIKLMTYRKDSFLFAQKK